jgi:GTP-binding protein Era
MTVLPFLPVALGWLVSPSATTQASSRCLTPRASAVGLDSTPSNHRAGFVSILGAPNVGKSTLSNALLGERLSIATSKAQTTRHRIMGMLNGDDHQIVFSDTPGVIQEPQYKMQEGMMGFVRSSIVDADVVLLVVDIFQEAAMPDEKLLRQLRNSPAAVLVLLNKVDLLADDAPRVVERRARLGTSQQLQQRWSEEFPSATVLPIAARSGVGVESVLKHIVALLPVHPPYYPKDQMTDKPERFFAAEMLREAIFETYEQEIPYSCECRIDSFKESEEIIRIRANIFVSHESQKGVVIGKKGSALKKVGIKARGLLEDFFQKQVYLETRVKVKQNWRQDPRALEEFGYLSPADGYL